MTFSKTHQNFSNCLSKPEALTEPQNFLGPNYETVLNFWLWIESLNQGQWKVVTDSYRNLDPAAWNAAWNAALNAAWSAAGDAALDAALDVVWNAVLDAAGIVARYAAAYATLELIGMHKLFEQGKTLIFVPLFDGL